MGASHFGEGDFFGGLLAEKEQFMLLAIQRNLKKRGIIFSEDDPGNSCFYIEKGVVRIFRTTAGGKEPIFFLRKHGEFFGLAEVMDTSPRKANAQAITPAVIYEIKRADFETLLAGSSKLSHKIITTLGKRIRYLGDQVENLMIYDVSTRLAKLLLYLGYDLLPDHGPITIPFCLTQEQMASMTGSCQQTVSEVLKKFHESAVIKVSGRQITLLDPQELLGQIMHAQD